MGIVVETLIELVGEDDFTVVSPQLNSHVKENLNVLFPSIHFMAMTETSISTFFDRAFSQTVTRRRQNNNIRYIGSDASGGHVYEQTNTTIPAAWAWCSDGVNGTYGCGFSGNVNVNVAEFEGIANAIIAHADEPASRIHIYSDSCNAVDMFNYDVTEGVIPREARKHGLVELTKDAMDIARSRKITVEWVKGHRNHRLNMIADGISRLARKRFHSGHKLEDFQRETDALYAMFNQNA